MGNYTQSTQYTFNNIVNKCHMHSKLAMCGVVSWNLMILVCRWSLLAGDFVRLFMSDWEVKKCKIFNIFYKKLIFHPQREGNSCFIKKTY